MSKLHITRLRKRTSGSRPWDQVAQVPGECCRDARRHRLSCRRISESPCRTPRRCHSVGSFCRSSHSAPVRYGQPMQADRGGRGNPLRAPGQTVGTQHGHRPEWRLAAVRPQDAITEGIGVLLPADRRHLRLVDGHSRGLSPLGQTPVCAGSSCARLIGRDADDLRTTTLFG